MLGAPKPLAALSSGLLARKGQARPAMRSQAFSLSELGAAGAQLGWNDMGDSVAPSATIGAPAETEPTVPAVLTERASLAQSLTPTEVPAAVTPSDDRVVSPPAATLSPVKARTAFTLRLDAERHRRLRLASATEGRSAQQLVTAALDAFLANLPVVDQLARQLDRTAK